MDSDADQLSKAREIAKDQPVSIREARIACPLCNASVPIRGLRERAVVQRNSSWQLIFTCPSCGLITRFAMTHATAKQLRAIRGSAWTNELVQYRWDTREDSIAQERSARPFHFISVLVISFLTWLVLTGSLAPLDMLWGFVVSAIVARYSYRLVAFELPRWTMHPRRWLYFVDLMIEFVRQLVVQNITLSLRVFRPNMSIHPGIVAVPTKLKGDVNLTFLGSLMTLTPDTVAVDVDEAKGIIYVHWIDVTSTDPEEIRRLLAVDLEDRIARWLL
jgi:multicomponent Na+:H+ antiporter subunit E